MDAEVRLCHVGISTSEAIYGISIHHLHEASLAAASPIRRNRPSSRLSRQDQDKYSHIYISTYIQSASIHAASPLQPPRPPPSRPARVPALNPPALHPLRSICSPLCLFASPACPTRHAPLHHRQGSASGRIHGGSASPRVDWALQRGRPWPVLFVTVWRKSRVKCRIEFEIFVRVDALSSPCLWGWGD